MSGILRIAVLQRVIKPYRVPLFTMLSSNDLVEFKAFYGEDVPGTKTRGISSPKGFSHRQLPTRNFTLPKRKLTWHTGLIAELRAYAPDVILCEGESHFLGYLQALYYRAVYARKTGLIYWCFISLPGRPVSEYGFKPFLKRFFRRFFDAFVLYSHYSKKSLTQLGYKPEMAFVATNVGDVTGHLLNADRTTESKSEARKTVGLPEKFTVLYVGTIDANKRPEVLLELAESMEEQRFNFVLCGSGSIAEDLEREKQSCHLDNVFLPGRVGDQLRLYYKAADVLIIPGRGGIVISEAMAFRLPVIVHQADGTEYDLVRHEASGLHLEEGEVSDFERAIEFLESNPEVCQEYGREGRRMVESEFTTGNMAKEIIRAASYASALRHDQSR